MGKQQWQDLGSLVAALAADSVRIQQRLDAAAAASHEQFAALLATVPEAWRSALLPLVPLRLAVTEHRVSCSLRTASARAVGFSLLVAPVHVGYSALYTDAAAEQSRLSVEVHATRLQSLRDSKI